MADAQKPGSWWQTLPGVLTGTAAVITALVALLAFLEQHGALRHKNPDPIVRPDEIGASTHTTPPTQQHASGATGEVRAGHYMFRLLGTSVETYATGPDGKPTKLALHCNIRVTDVLGMSDYVDRMTIRLAVDGAELLPENGINFAVYDKQAAETEALFVIPADARKLELLVGHPGDAVSRLPVTLTH